MNPAGLHIVNPFIKIRKQGLHGIFFGCLVDCLDCSFHILAPLDVFVYCTTTLRASVHMESEIDTMNFYVNIIPHYKQKVYP